MKFDAIATTENLVKMQQATIERTKIRLQNPELLASINKIDELTAQISDKDLASTPENIRQLTILSSKIYKELIRTHLDLEQAQDDMIDTMTEMSEEAVKIIRLLIG